MEELKKSVMKSLDGTDLELFPYFPYILQDLWEFGADPTTMLILIKKNINKKNLSILDLGCGKGAVSINIAKEVECKIKGIDAVPEFINSANEYACKYNVHNKCSFETGDIRLKIDELRGYDLIILGAIGSVFGNMETSLRTVSFSLLSKGYVLLDDGYIDDNSETDYDRCLRKSDFYKQIKNADFHIVEEFIFTKDKLEESDDFIYDTIKKRINELIKKHPAKKEMLEEYLKHQEYENHMIENVMVTGTWLLQKN